MNEPKADSLATIRHALYADVRDFLESCYSGADDLKEEITGVIRRLDAFYVLTGRMTVGNVDGESEIPQ